MFELKKHVKERLIKRTEGIISLLLIVLLVPFYSVAAILEEVGRYQSALRGLDSAISSSEMSVLAQYDQFLMDRFALLAIDQNKNIDQQFLSYLKKQDTQDTRSFSLSNAQTKATGVYPLADIEVLYQQINEFSTYTVPTKLILEGVNFDNIVSQLEGYSTTVSNVIKQLNSVGSSLQGGLDSYNAQKEASEQLDAVTKTTGEYAESYNRFKNAMDSLIEHKKTERPENEKEAAQWDEQLKNLLQEANTAKDDYQNQIDKERDGISSLAKKFDTAASKERSAYDTLVDGVTTAVSTKQASEKDVLNKNIQDNKGVIKEIDRQLAALGDDPQGENREEKRQLKALRDQVQERINEDTDSINKIANETTSMKEITDELKTGDNAKDVLEDYNSEACVDSLKGLNEEMEFLKGMDLETMNADSLENLAGKLHQVDLSKFSDTSSYKELWNNVRQSVGQESIQGVPMDFIDGIFALLSIDTLYDEDLNSKIDLNYYGKLPSQRIRSAQEYSLDSPFEKEDQKTAQDNLNKIGLPISEADSVELDGGINVGGQADDDGEATGNLFKKMIQMVNRLKKKMEGYKAVVLYRPVEAAGQKYDPMELTHFVFRLIGQQMPRDSRILNVLSRQLLYGGSFSFAELEPKLKEKPVMEKIPEPVQEETPRYEERHPIQAKPYVPPKPVMEPPKPEIPKQEPVVPEPAQDNPFAQSGNPFAEVQPKNEKPQKENKKAEKKPEKKSGGLFGLFGGKKDKKKAGSEEQENPFQQKEEPPQAAQKAEMPRAQRPAPVSAPMQAPAAPKAEAGRTVLLSGSENGGTTKTMVMGSGTTGAGELYLVQKDTNQYIHVTHTNFHIGRAENIVDYTVQTRNHYLGNDHAYILLDGGNYYIVDNNTQNHTYLNERRLEPSKPTLFHAGDTIRMADVVFNVIMGS